jgi:hypothetical protein
MLPLDSAIFSTDSGHGAGWCCAIGSRSMGQNLGLLKQHIQAGLPILSIKKNS